MLDNMSIEQIRGVHGSAAYIFEKEVEDDDGNTVVTNCVDMRTIFAAMEASGAMTEEQILSMRDTVSDTIDTMGSSLVKSMGIAYAVSCIQRQEWILIRYRHPISGQPVAGWLRWHFLWVW